MAVPVEQLHMEIKNLEDGKENPFSTLSDDGPWLVSLSATHKLHITDTVNVCLISDDRLQDIRRIYIPTRLKGYRLVSTVDNLIAIENTPKNSRRIYIIDPFSSSSWASPALPLSTGTDREIMKIAMLGDITFALEGSSLFLSYAAPGMKEWVRPEKFRFISWLDMISSKKDGVLYLLSIDADKVESLGFPSSPSLFPQVEDWERKDMTFNLTDGYDPLAKENQGWACCQNARLVDSPYGIFLVRWRLLSRDGEENRRDIDVQRLLVNGPDTKWVTVKSLDNHAFFLGALQSIAVSTEDFPKLRSNRIYIHCDAFYPFKNEADNMVDIKLEDFLIHNLEDGTWSKLSNMKDLLCHLDLELAVWMTPPQRKSALKRKYEEHLETETTTTPGETHGNC